MRLWTCSIREIQRRPGRTLLTLLGITLGLAAIVATRLTIHRVSQAYRELFDDLVGQPCLEITAKGQGGFEPKVARTLENLTGVRAVRPRIQGAAAVVAPGGSVPVTMLGIDTARAAEEWPLREGGPIGSKTDALLDPALAKALHLAVGQDFRLWSPTGPTRLRLAGIFKPRAASAAAGGQMIVSLSCAQHLFGLPGQINSIQVLVHDPVEPSHVLALLERELPEGLTVGTAGMRGEMARSSVGVVEQGLSSLSVVAVVAAGFVILNTFLLNLGERRKQLALLRALGATQAQVLRLLLAEMLLLGLAATLAGCGLGVGLAMGLNWAMGHFLGIPLPGLRLSPGPFLLAGWLGPATALAAACLPAWRASRRPPLAELLPGQAHAEEVLPGRIWGLGLGLLALGLTLNIGLWTGCFSEAAGKMVPGLALGLLLVGCVLALPLAIDPLLHLVGRLRLGLEARLAAQQLVRNRGRTALTSGVLFLALVVAIAFGQSVRTTLDDLRHWYRHTILADFLVRAAMPDTSFLVAPALPEALADEIRSCDEVQALDRIAFLPARAENLAVLVLARTFSAGQPLPLDLQAGDEATVRTALQAGQVVLGGGLAQRLGRAPGDVLRLATRQGERELLIAGIAREYAGGGMALYLDWETSRQLLGLPGAHVFLVSARKGRLSELGAALGRFCQDRHLLLQSNADLRELIDASVGRVTGVLWALMALAFAVASLGIVNTLTMNVHDQTRDLCLLRALGLQRRQVRKVVRAQALLLAGIVLPPGVLGGMALSYAIAVHRASASWTGPQAPFEVDPVVLLGCCVLAVAMSVLASLGPARRAARLSVTQALQHA